MPIRPADVDFCLDPLTVLDCEPEETVTLAAASGCRFVSLWVQSPGANFPAQCQVSDAATAERVRRRMQAEGVRPLNLEVFDLTPGADVPSYGRALDMGAAMGARCATAIFRGHTEPERMLEQFVELCQLAGRFGLRVNAEFISYQSLGSLAQTLELLDRAAQPNAGIVIDILHLVRSGGSTEEVRGLDTRLVGHAQMCDGPATIRPEDRSVESGSNRQVPGEGEFPIRGFYEALPPIPLGLEVPFKSTAFQGLTPRERVERVVRSTRRAIGAADPVG